jgi:hypothetical protein
MKLTSWPLYQPTESIKKAKANMKNKPKNATEERNVPTTRNQVKIDQPLISSITCAHTQEIVAHCSLKLSQIISVSSCLCDIEPRHEDSSKADPEGTVRCERKSPESVPTSELPHPCHKLSQATVSEGYINLIYAKHTQSNDNVWD